MLKAFAKSQQRLMSIAAMQNRYAMPSMQTNYKMLQ